MLAFFAWWVRAQRARGSALDAEVEQRARAEAALRESEAHHRSVFEAVSDALIVSDGDGRVLDANPAAEDLFASPSRPVRGRLRSELVRQSRSLPIPGGGTGIGTRADGETFPARISTVALGPDRFLTSVVDLAPMLDLQERLAGARRMEAIGRLAGGVAHVINNQLTVARAGAADLRVAVTDDADPAVLGMIEQIVRATVRGSELTRELLTFGQRQLLRTEPVDLVELFGRLRPVLDEIVRPPRTLTVTMGHGRTIVLSDPTHLAFALENLVSNAIEATAEDGVIRLTVQPHAAVDARASWPDLPAGPDAWVQLVVEDNGKGIPAEHLPHVFEPFFTTKDGGGEGGLGLATVHGFLTQSAGQIYVTSTLGRGTRFDVLLPCAPLEVTPETASRRTAAAKTEGVVLVCDDDPLVRRTVERLIRHAGFVVSSAENAASALERLAKGDVDVLVTDVQMPGTTGIELARRAVARQPALGVILISGYAATLTPDELPGRLISKPFDPEALIDAVRDVMGGVRS